MTGTTRRRIVAALGGAVIVGGVVALPAAAAPAHSSSSTTVLETPTIAVTTSTGHHVRLSISTLRDSSLSPKTILSITLARGSVESHTWDFPVSSSRVVLNAQHGTGHIDTGKQLGSYGSVKLAVSAEGSASACSSSSPGGASGGVSYASEVRVAGTIGFVTHSHGAWGQVGGAHSHVAFSDSVLSKTSDAGGCVRTPCPPSGISYQAEHDSTDGDYTLLRGGSSAKGTTVILDRTVSLDTAAIVKTSSPARPRS